MHKQYLSSQYSTISSSTQHVHTSLAKFSYCSTNFWGSWFFPLCETFPLVVLVFVDDVIDVLVSCSLWTGILGNCWTPNCNVWRRDAEGGVKLCKWHAMYYRDVWSLIFSIIKNHSLKIDWQLRVKTSQLYFVECPGETKTDRVTLLILTCLILKNMFLTDF